ncbi:MAG TPA: hypothetical protein VIM73_16450 [Polyangiaceae bacterium]
MSTSGVEVVEHGGTAYALVLRASATSTEKYNFLTDAKSPLQLGMNFYQRGETVKAHYHLPRHIETEQVQEFLLIGAGRALLTFYELKERAKVAHVQLETGDMVLLLAGGHGLEIQEDTKIVEIKQGPYDGKTKDKVVFGA